MDPQPGQLWQRDGRTRKVMFVIDCRVFYWGSGKEKACAIDHWKKWTIGATLVGSEPVEEAPVICSTPGCGEVVQRAQGSSVDRCRGCRSVFREKNPDPTPEEIDAICKAIQEGRVEELKNKAWTPDDYKRRSRMVIGDLELTMLDLGPVRKPSTVGKE